MKDARWKQPTPQMQLRAIAAGFEGHAFNYETRVIKAAAFADTAADYAGQFIALLPYLEGKESWNKVLVANRIVDQQDRVLIYGDNESFHVIAPANTKVREGERIEYQDGGVNFGWFIQVLQ